MNKSETLIYLESRLKHALILPQLQLSFEESIYPSHIEQSVRNRFPSQKRFVVRSSFSEEDLENASLAGKYKSIVDVGIENIPTAVKDVFDSYQTSKSDEIVFIQPYLSDTIRNGVLFSHVPQTGQPYLVDNYVKNADTTHITSGAKHGFKHVCLRHNLDLQQFKCEEAYCSKLTLLSEECLEILNLGAVDIEYAVNSNQEIFVFQVRPLAIERSASINLPDYLQDSESFLKRNMRPLPFLGGEKTIYGVMPDWNPAEMIGRRPKNLALSLYRELITDSIWAYQRDNYGYKALRSFPLLVEINNQPFIDTRVSFNSLLPKNLDSELEGKLVNHYIGRLEANKNFHDKIEFEIVLSSWIFDLDYKLSELPTSFTSKEKSLLFIQLQNLTRKVIKSSLLDDDIARVTNLKKRKLEINRCDPHKLTDLYWLLEDCKRWGTLPFAGLARAAFIATQIIKSLERVTNNFGILNRFIESLNTVTKQMQIDLEQDERAVFLEKYGHLRPGTYDITSLTYKENFETYFGNRLKINDHKQNEFDFFEFVEALNEENIEGKLGVTSNEFVDFARKAIFWREQAKFEFTKNLSEILDLIVDLGAGFGISREDLAFLDIKDLLQTYSSSSNIQKCLEQSINEGKTRYVFASNIELPALITSTKDLFSFTEQDAQANFISNKKVVGQPSTDLFSLEGKIALIEGADPGFDWIFQHRIAGLITAWGGANSHMSIRCSELGVPAVIGVGERLFEALKNSKTIYLDCSNRLLEYR